MRVLVIGSGGREHALVWRLGADASVDQIVCAPGNPGIAALCETRPVPVSDVDGLVGLARERAVDLTVVGPEAPLAEGLADRLQAGGLAVLGPSRDAARLETSKIFAKDFMARHSISSAAYRACTTRDDAVAAVHELGGTVVIKADGLAAGKGVVVADDATAAIAAIDAAMVEGRFGAAGARVVVEERLVGEEASFFALCDGDRALTLGSAQDHKRVFDGDDGPNTGGMGAFAPSPLVTPQLESRILDDIVAPVLAGMRGEGAPYRGFLYVGLMLTAAGPKVIEFNVRFGDPEAQVVLPALEGDLASLFAAAARGRLGDLPRPSTSRPHVGVVLASNGYPGTFERGKEISGVSDASRLDDVLVFHAGTMAPDRRLLTDGGRVMTVVGRGADFRSAIDRAYAAARLIHFDGMHFRRDIGRRALRH